jgi:hypothetical protein
MTIDEVQPFTLNEHQLWIAASLGCFSPTVKIDYDEYKDGCDCNDEKKQHILSESDYNRLLACDLIEIIVGQEMSEDRVGGDDICEIADATVKAIKDGYQVHIYYGEEAEVLILAYRYDQLTITKAPPTEDI